MGHTHVLRGKCRPAGMILPRLEHRFVGATFSLSSAVALTILSSITSGMIALTGIVLFAGVRDGAIQCGRLFAAAGVMDFPRSGHLAFDRNFHGNVSLRYRGHGLDRSRRSQRSAVC
jgi:hypothetical protein